MSSLFAISDAQIELLSSVWTKKKYSAIVFPDPSSRGQSSQELHRKIQTHSNRVNRNIINRFEVDIFNVSLEGIDGNPFAVCYSPKEINKGHHSLVKARGELGSFKAIKGMSEEEYDESGSFSPDRSKFQEGLELINFPQNLTDNDFFNKIFVPALENIYGKERVITRKYSGTPVSSAGSSPAPSPCSSPLTVSASPVPNIDYSAVSWNTVVAHECKITSYKNDVFYLSSKENMQFKLKPNVFQSFLDKFSNIEELITHFRTIDSDLPNLRKSLPDKAEEELQECLKVSIMKRNNARIQFLEKAIANVQNQTLIADALYDMRHINNWTKFQSLAVDALKSANNYNQFYCVLQISTGVLPDGRVLTLSLIHI